MKKIMSIENNSIIRRMLKKLTMLYSFISIFFPGCNENIIAPEKYGTGDDYNIYREILIDRSSESGFLIVLNDSTFGEHYDSASLGYFCKNVEGLYGETVMDYIINNKKGMKLCAIPGFNNYIFSSEYKGNKVNTTYITLSKIGYDRSKSQAILTVAQSYRVWDGGGLLFFLKKESNRWKIKKILGTWIS